MSIDPIGAINGALPALPALPTLDTPATAPATAPTTGSGVDFGAALSNGLERLQQVQTNADNLAVQAADGTLADPAQYMIASTQASLATQLTVAVRNKAVDAFNEIMRMQA
ncbi:flagellar hook-basal body complex protein FliE [Planosporangium thailandense]|uniref:Flagellar hook-basal body complex protein FliE n=1 Tax=Planosporangium thailandense TaxID=765197 RepID=A0ABX0Y0X6_9ACTN|nr:flagellar hook-basal body complex protein FliE [Planosporangium thailandense]NJC71797.1 flagellar hook-basal body complex protein FliE [Planosporangium thailandense]